MQQYDANGDGTLDTEELKQSPALMEAVEPFEGQSHTPMDADGNRMLTEQEIANRVDDWLRTDAAVLNASVSFTLDGEPLAGATVTFEPEECLRPALKSCSAVTDDHGQATPAGPDPKYPGLHVGLYRIRLSKVVDGKETIPARYNAETTLAKEIAADAPSSHRSFVFHLESE
jgi:hypothetical protein